MQCVCFSKLIITYFLHESDLLKEEAYHRGLSIVEVKEFIYSKQKESVSK
jgi:hypothetical protein